MYSEPVSNAPALNALDEAAKVVFVERDLKAWCLVTMVSGSGEDVHAAAVINGQPLHLCTRNNQIETVSVRVMSL